MYCASWVRVWPDLYQYVCETVRAAEPRQTPELWTYGAEGNLMVAYSVRGPVIEPAFAGPSRADLACWRRLILGPLRACAKGLWLALVGLCTQRSSLLASGNEEED